MVNLFDFQFAEKVRIIDVDGNEYVGNVIAVFDKDETADGVDDDITISMDGQYIGFRSREIASITEV